MPNVYVGHEFESLKCRFENQTELLYRMTLIDLRIFTAYITLQLALGAWIATNGSNISDTVVKIGLLIIDLVLGGITAALIYNNYRRRKEVVGIVKNCNSALGYETKGTYLEGEKLNVETKFRPWAGWYFIGIVFGCLGIALVLFSAGGACQPCR